MGQVAEFERTLVLVKPDGVQRGLVGEIIARLERRGLKIVALELQHLARPLAQRHYAEHEGKDFYDSLVGYITSGPVVAMVLEGPDAIAVTRATVGATRPVNAAPGTIRGDFGLTVGRNLIHASDKAESAAREIDLFFGGRQLRSFVREIDRWVLDS